MPIDYTQLGERIRISRLQKNISQEKLAEAVELSRTYMGCIERGEKRPSLDKLSDISLALEVSTDWLLGMEPVCKVALLLADCSSEETDILTQNLDSLKSVLHSFSIKKK